MKKRRIIIAVISIIVVAAMVLFDMLYMKKDKKEELPQEEKKVEEIVWITESSIEGVQSEMEEALNALLKKRGCEYKVRFVCFPMETYEEDVAEYLENNSADIIYSNLRVVGDDSNQYYSFYKNGYLQNLEKIREDEKFYDAYSGKTWEHMEINGEIYGIPSYSYEGNGLYYVFNQQYLDKYNVDISQVTGDLQTLYPILTELSEKEKDNKAFVPLHSYEYMIYAPEYTEILDTIRVKEGMEKPIAENLLNNEQVKESVLLLNEFHKNGLLKEGSANTLANGNFFVMLMYADDPELLQEYFDTICEENNKKPLSLKYVKIGEHYPPHRTGGMNSVLKGGNTEKAIDLLKRTVTDEEISNLLKYGTEEMEETPAMLQWMFGNDQWSKEKNAVKESLIAGFQFDGRVYKEQIDQLSQIYYSYSELFRGLSENPQEDYEKMMQEMEAAGINAITEEVNNQLDQWYNTVR